MILSRFHAACFINVVCSLYFRVYCQTPSRLQLIPKIQLPVNLPPCPVTLESGGHLPAPHYRPLDLAVLVSDSHGRVFDNISSLTFDWSVSDKKLADIVDSSAIKVSSTTADGGTTKHTCKLSALCLSVILTLVMPGRVEASVCHMTQSYRWLVLMSEQHKRSDDRSIRYLHKQFFV